MKTNIQKFLTWSATLCASFTLCACGDSSTGSSSEDDNPAMEEDDAEDQSSSSEIGDSSPSQEESSNSLPKLTSSSSQGVSSSSSLGLHWDGERGLTYVVQTGLDNGSGTAGYWLTFSDNTDGGASQIVWPVDTGDSDENAMQPIIAYCHGICGSFELNSKGTLTYDPFVGVYFNIAGTDDGGAPTTADASSWGGICLDYSSTHEITIELGIGSRDKLLAYDNPIVKLQSGGTGYYSPKCFEWSDFEQAGWFVYENGIAMTGEEAATMLAAIRFKIQGRNGTTGSFIIHSIDTYNSSSY